MFDSIDKVIEGIVGLIISLAIAYWVLSNFLPLNDWSHSVKQALGRKKRCHNCNTRNHLNAHHCMHCGVEL